MALSASKFLKLLSDWNADLCSESGSTLGFSVRVLALLKFRCDETPIGFSVMRLATPSFTS